MDEVEQTPLQAGRDLRKNVANLIGRIGLGSEAAWFGGAQVEEYRANLDPVTRALAVEIDRSIKRWDKASDGDYCGCTICGQCPSDDCHDPAKIETITKTAEQLCQEIAEHASYFAFLGDGSSNHHRIKIITAAGQLRKLVDGKGLEATSNVVRLI